MCAKINCLENTLEFNILNQIKVLFYYKNAVFSNTVTCTALLLWWSICSVMQVPSVLKFVNTAHSQQHKKRKKCESQMTNVHVKEELFLHKTKVIQAEVVPQKLLVVFWYI